VLRTDGGPAYSLFVEPRDRAMETWNGYRPGVEGAVQDFGADEAHPNGELLDKIPELIRGAQRVYHTLGRDAAFDARLVAALDQMRLRSRANNDPADAIVDARSITHAMRLFKEPGELDVMRRARRSAARATQRRRGSRGRARSSTSCRPRSSTRSARTARADPPTPRSSAAARTPRCCTTCATTRSCARTSWF
jgi:Xaa-Pro aminopeptidase